MVKELIIDSEGRIEIPEEIFKHSKFKPGQRVKLLTRANGDLILEPVIDFRDLFGSLDPKGKKATVKEMNEAIEEEVVSQWLRSTRIS